MTPHPATLEEEVLLKDCVREQLRRGGPGGQHRNKVATAVRLTHTPSGLHAEANERRSVKENAPRALFRLRVRLATELRTAWTTPSPLWTSRCKNKRLVINPEHPDYPALLAESLDALQSLEADLAETAAALNTTASQLDKLWRHHPQAHERAREAVNRR
jgi:hypothetical protein